MTLRVSARGWRRAPKLEGGYYGVSSNAIALKGSTRVSKAISENKIHGAIEEYANVVKNAIRAGFNGVEVHNGNG
ncbi:hypothetical protein N7475_006977 [Penicillium sp. IBT 31633x]|nr:hypothetical protein N7475_006977 [Penicillium sp. IBT 31633x]